MPVVLPSVVSILILTQYICSSFCFIGLSTCIYIYRPPPTSPGFGVHLVIPLLSEIPPVAIPRTPFSRFDSHAHSISTCLSTCSVLHIHIPPSSHSSSHSHSGSLASHHRHHPAYLAHLVVPSLGQIPKDAVPCILASADETSKLILSPSFR
jgi:hypothetical protein